MMEPILLEDYRYGDRPKSLLNLLEFFKNERISADKNNILAGFVYILMIESGFVPLEYTEPVEDCDFNYQRLLKLSQSLPEGWKRHRNYCFNFILKSGPEYVCTLSCLTACDDFIINCVIKDLGSFSLLLDPFNYFVSSLIDLDRIQFQNLNHLSRLFKNEISFPAKCMIIRKLGSVCASIEDIPLEIQLEIYSYLKIVDLINLAKTCKSLCRSAQDSSLWIKLLDLDLRKKAIFKTVDELKFLYEIKYERELNRIMNCGP